MLLRSAHGARILVGMRPITFILRTSIAIIVLPFILGWMAAMTFLVLPFWLLVSPLAVLLFISNQIGAAGELMALPIELLKKEFPKPLAELFNWWIHGSKESPADF